MCMVLSNYSAKRHRLFHDQSRSINRRFSISGRKEEREEEQEYKRSQSESTSIFSFARRQFQNVAWCKRGGEKAFPAAAIRKVVLKPSDIIRFIPCRVSSFSFSTLRSPFSGGGGCGQQGRTICLDFDTVRNDFK
jgi:hypothetical protein